MERRKLFSDNAVATTRRKLFSTEVATAQQPKRRKLFSEEENTNLIRGEEGKEIIVCSDCGKAYYYDGTTTNLICPNCGGMRFNYASEITANKEPNDAPPAAIENPIDKVFSEKRVQLFSNDLEKSEFSKTGICGELPQADKSSLTTETHTENKTLYTCSDCGHQFAADEKSSANVVCPKCGGTRVELSSQLTDVIGSDEDSDNIDEYLKESKGKQFSTDEVDSELIKRGIYSDLGGVQGLINAGYVTEVNDSEVKFSDLADLQHKLFSELVTSVTKEFSINPIQDKESAIESLSGRLSERCMSALKKASRYEEHQLEAVNFSDKDYINDSGIANDLSAEYGGSSLKLKDFMNLLSSEYPDAPDNIVDLLVNDKVIKITGSQVEIKK